MNRILLLSWLFLVINSNYGQVRKTTISELGYFTTKTQSQFNSGVFMNHTYCFKDNWATGASVSFSKTNNNVQHSIAQTKLMSRLITAELSWRNVYYKSIGRNISLGFLLNTGALYLKPTEKSATRNNDKSNSTSNSSLQFLISPGVDFSYKICTTPSGRGTLHAIASTQYRQVFGSTIFGSPNDFSGLTANCGLSFRLKD